MPCRVSSEACMKRKKIVRTISYLFVVCMNIHTVKTTCCTNIIRYGIYDICARRQAVDGKGILEHLS